MKKGPNWSHLLFDSQFFASSSFCSVCCFFSGSSPESSGRSPKVTDFLCLRGVASLVLLRRLLKHPTLLKLNETLLLVPSDLNFGLSTKSVPFASSARLRTSSSTLSSSDSSFMSSAAKKRQAN